MTLPAFIGSCSPVIKKKKSTKSVVSSKSKSSKKIKDANARTRTSSNSKGSQGEGIYYVQSGSEDSDDR